MKVLKKTKTADGIELLMEDWSEDYPSVHHGADQLAAYPIAKHSHYPPAAFYSPYPKKDERFRLGMHFPSEEMAEQAFGELESGSKKLADFVQLFDCTPRVSAEDFLSCL